MNDALLPLAVILLTAELGGLVADRLGLTRVGQIVAGIIVGPSLLRLVSDDSIISPLASMGALAILAIAGLETDIALMRGVGRATLLAAIGGVALPMAGGTLVILALGYDARAALFCGAVLTATSVGITAAALRELGLLSSAAGTTILGAAVIDDVLGLIVLGVVVADTGGAPRSSWPASTSPRWVWRATFPTISPRSRRYRSGLPWRGASRPPPLASSDRGSGDPAPSPDPPSAREPWLFVDTGDDGQCTMPGRATES